MAYITHKRDDGEYQLLLDHLLGVSKQAGQFAAPFGAENHASQTGLLHDIGKYSQAAQARQRDPEHIARVDHSTAGAQAVITLFRDVYAASAIAGHHGGLMNAGSKAGEDGTLKGRLKKVLIKEYDPSAWKAEVSLPTQASPPVWLNAVPQHLRMFSSAFYIRFLFSCLVDADYLDTEFFMNKGAVDRPSPQPLPELLEMLRAYIAPWLENSSSELNRKRSDILQKCLKGNEWPKGLYTLTIPTGGGKTISSLAFGLTHAIAHGLSRLIYVIPYTSIIEQNAQVFRKILGEEAVLEHHANIDLDDDECNRMRLAAENWDAPIVVTTAVQFFESLYSCKTSRCRKLHNIANAVIIFDEAQMMPVPFLRPCVNAIAELVQHYGSTAVLCTATQPALGGLFAEYSQTLGYKEIVEDAEELHTFFRRVQFFREGIIQEETLAEQLNRTQQVLCIVNSRKKAHALFQQLEPAGRFHLSTLMTSENRSRTLERIKECLSQGLPCRVVSTSLIEAGVDLDFPTVWREENGLDSILQAAGRCNREGKRPLQDSLVHIFRFNEAPPKMFAQNVIALNKVLEKYEDIASPEAIAAYYHQLLFVMGPDALDANDIIAKNSHLAFRDVDASFHIIDNQTIPVYIPTAENAPLLQELRECTISRSGLRKLGRSAVNVYRQHFDALCLCLEYPMDESYGILLDMHQYDEECGLMLEPKTGETWFA